jgi:dTDP-4-amino-4,6-dideoxygalactose transaminase
MKAVISSGKLRILGGDKAKTPAVPIWPQHDAREIEILTEVCRTGNWGGFPMPNTHARAFADSFAQYHGAKHGLCAANGTVTLEICMKAAGVRPGDEVIVPAYTWDGTAAAVLFVEAIPVFVDVCPDSYCLDPDLMEAAITPRTRAVIPVHLGMNICDMDRILPIAAKHGLKVIEDCAHAHGAKWKGQGAGSIGHLGSFSFQTSKLMTAGEGGMILTSDDELNELCQSYINCSRPTITDVFKHRVLGHNYRLSEFQAAVLRIQLQRLEEQTAQRKANAEYLTERLASLPGITPLRWDPRITTPAIYQYLFKFNSASLGGLSREHLIAALEMEGIPSDGIFYEPVYRSSLFTPKPEQFDALRRYPQRADFGAYRCPVSERAAYEEAVWLPHHVLLGDRDYLKYVADTIERVIDQRDELIDMKHPLIDLRKMNRATRALQKSDRPY